MDKSNITPEQKASRAQLGQLMEGVGINPVSQTNLPPGLRKGGKCRPSEGFQRATGRPFVSP